MSELGGFKNSTSKTVLDLFNLAVLIQYQRVTDGQTDIIGIAKTCFSIANGRKKL